MPEKPQIPPDETSAKVREALGLLRRALDHLRDARELFDEASEIEGLPPTLSAELGAEEGILGALYQHFGRGVDWIDDKAELLYSRHSPLQRGSAPSDQSGA